MTPTARERLTRVKKHTASESFTRQKRPQLDPDTGVGLDYITTSSWKEKQGMYSLVASFVKVCKTIHFPEQEALFRIGVPQNFSQLRNHGTRPTSIKTTPELVFLLFPGVESSVGNQAVGHFSVIKFALKKCLSKNDAWH